MKKVSLFIVILICIGSSLTSCLVSSKLDSNVSYASPTFSKFAVERDGLALLPITAGMGVEGYRRPFGEAMNKVGNERLNNFTTWNMVLDMFNQAEIVTEYNNAIRSYQETGIIDRSVLRLMADATGTNYFFFVRLAPPEADRRTTYSPGFGTSTTETKSVSAYGLIWSAIDGDVVWEGIAKAEVVTGDFSYTQETDMDRANKVAKALMESAIK
jgi:hypothetical protein